MADNNDILAGSILGFLNSIQNCYGMSFWKRLGHILAGTWSMSHITISWIKTHDNRVETRLIFNAMLDH